MSSGGASVVSGDGSENPKVVTVEDTPGDTGSEPVMMSSSVYLVVMWMRDVT